MKKVMVAIAAIVVLAITAAVALPFLVSGEKIKAEVADSVKAATGRELSIAGKVAISVFPSLSVQVADVALSNPPGFRNPNFIKLSQMDIRLKLLPLLTGHVEVDSFKLIDPVIALEVDRQGRGNWRFEDKSGKAESAKTADSGATISEIQLGDVGIENGKLSYSDAKTGATEEFDTINVKVSLQSLDQPLDIKGSANWRKQTVGFNLNVGKPRVLVAGTGTTPIAANVSADQVKMTFTGAAEGAEKSIAGDVDLSMPSVRALVAWTTGKPLDLPGSGFGPLTIKGKLRAAGSHIAFSQAAIGLDAIKSTGELAFDSVSGKTAIKGRLDVEMLDLNPYLPAAAPGKEAASPQGWSDAPIDAGALKTADVDFALKVGGIKLQKIQVGRSALTVSSRNGRLATDLTELELYKGAGKGSIKIDGTGAGIGMEASFSLKSLQVEPLLTDAAGFERLSGTGNIELRVTGRGRSQREIISSLSGDGSIAFLDGAIKGIDIAGMVRNITTAFTGGAAARKTDFAELSGTYTIADGILSNKDLAMKAPIFRVSGAGTIDLPRRSLNYRIEPKVAATLEGQGGKDAIGLMVPVIIAGPWDNLSYRPDLGAVAKGAATQAIKGALGGKFPSLPGLPGGLFPKR